MKFRIFITILLAALLISGFSGCSLVRMADHLDNAADLAEDRIEQAIQEIRSTDPPVPLAPTPGVEAPTAPATILTAEEAQTIALKHAGFTAHQVQYLHTEYAFDDGIPQYEVQFRYGGFEYDYEIHAESGDILSYDRDD